MEVSNAILKFRQMTNEASLGNFYILTPSLATQNPQEPMKRFLQEYLKTTLNFDFQFENGELSREHRDLQFFMTAPDANKYTQEDIQDFFRFSDFKPVSWPYRLIIFWEAQKLLGSKLQHKLLKILEEPTVNTTTLFISTTPAPNFISTIKSRAISWTISNKENDSQRGPQENELYLSIQNQLNLLQNGQKSVHQTIEFIKQLENGSLSWAQIEDTLQQIILSHCCSDYQQTTKVLESVKSLSLQRPFHNPKSGRISALISHMTKN